MVGALILLLISVSVLCGVVLYSAGVFTGAGRYGLPRIDVGRFTGDVGVDTQVPTMTPSSSRGK
jgi:hypothetical protein